MVAADGEVDSGSCAASMRTVRVEVAVVAVASSSNAGHAVDPPAPSTCWPYGGSVPLNRAQERQLLSLYTLPPSACTSAHIFEI